MGVSNVVMSRGIIGGGESNIVSGQYSSIVGGLSNTIKTDSTPHSLAAVMLTLFLMLITLLFVVGLVIKQVEFTISLEAGILIA